MSSQLEAILYFAVMALVLLITFRFTYLKIKNRVSFGNTIKFCLLLSLALFSLACLWWGLFASDGFSQVFGWLIYGITFVVTNLIIIGTLYVVKKKRIAL